MGNPTINSIGKVLPDVGLRDVNPIMYGEEQCLPDKGPVRTLRDYYLIHYIFSGSGKFQTAEKEYTVTGGQVFILHPQEMVIYETDPHDPWHYMWVGFTTHLDIPRLQQKHLLNARQYESLFRDIATTDNQMQGVEYHLAGRVMEFLSTLVRPEETGQKTFVDLAVEYLSRNYTRPITIEGIAEQFHVTHSYFSTAFHQKMGISPSQYLMDLRLTRAVELMTAGGCNVSEAAISVGYSSIYNFSKMFKKKYGISPSQYVHKK